MDANTLEVLSTLLLLAALAALAILFMGFIFLILKRTRRRGWRMLVWGFVGFLVSGFSALYLEEKKALKLGFSSRADLELARNFGFTDPVVWKEQRDEVLAQQRAERRAAEREERERKLKEDQQRRKQEALARENRLRAEQEALEKKAKTAGFSNVADYQWVERAQQELGQSCKFQLTLSATGVTCSDVPALSMKSTYHLTAISIYDFGKWMKSSDSWRDGELWWTVIVETVDKYGIESQTRAFTISFQIPDLQKVNYDNISQVMLLNFATIEKVRLFARKGLVEFCATYGDKDGRFCREVNRRYARWQQ